MRKETVKVIQNIIDQSRVMSFSDAVFAFAATLLVLKIDLPAIPAGQASTYLPIALFDLWPTYLANIVSFLIIGYYWLNHHAIFGVLKKLDGPIVWLNMLFLIAVSFLPFPVDLYGDYSTQPVVVLFFTGSVAVVGYLLAVIWGYIATHKNLTETPLTKKHLQFYTLNVLMAPVIFTLSMPLVYVHPVLAQASWVLVIIGVWIVNKHYVYETITEID